MWDVVLLLLVHPKVKFLTHFRHLFGLIVILPYFNAISVESVKSTFHTGIFKGCGYSSRLWLQFLKDVATGKNGRFVREFSSKSTTNALFTEVMLSMPI